MIKSKLELKGNGSIKVNQRIIVKCDFCESVYESSLYNQRRHYEKYSNDLCRGCKQKEQYKLGMRDVQKEHIANYATNTQKGKTYSELYSKEKSDSIKSKISSAMSTDNPRWSLKYRTQEEIDKAKKELGNRITNTRKGKSYSEIYGKEKADNIKLKLSVAMSGEKNHMYGKPAPKGSGSGIDGWHKDFYFRSILELSFLLDMHKKGFVVVNAETNNFKVNYKVNENVKNYFPDFYLPEIDTVVEVKPSSMINEHINVLKFSSAMKKFKNFKVLTEKDFPKINKKELKKLVDNNIVKLRNYLI